MGTNWAHSRFLVRRGGPCDYLNPYGTIPFMERATGFEPATSTLGRWHSTAELRPPVYREPKLLVQFVPVAFKHNLPVPIIALVLVALGIVALVVFHTPPDEDLIRQAVERYVAGLGPVKQMEIHGTVADIILAENGRLIYAEFEKKNGSWTFARNLAEEFSRTVKDPEVQKDIRQRLGEKVSQRMKASVTLKEGIDLDYRLARDASSGSLVGQCLLRFAYPRVGDQQRRGEYLEDFEWKDGRWQSCGPGALYDRVGP